MPFPLLLPTAAVLAISVTHDGMIPVVKPSITMLSLSIRVLLSVLESTHADDGFGDGAGIYKSTHKTNKCLDYPSITRNLSEGGIHVVPCGSPKAEHRKITTVQNDRAFSKPPVCCWKCENRCCFA